MTHSAENDAPKVVVRPHYRCGIGRKREHEAHSFRAYLMAGIVRLRCPGYRVTPPEVDQP